MLRGGDFSSILSFSPGKRGHVLRALAALSKFLGCYDEFRESMKRHGVKWSEGGSGDYMLKRIAKTSGGELLEWLREIHMKAPELAAFINFLTFTGLRLEDGIRSWNLIIELNQQKRLGEYYNFDIQALEHFKFSEVFMRGRKRCFISFVPEKLIMEIVNHSKITRDSIYCKLKRKKLKIMFSEIREYYASVMTKYLRQPEIDFLQGRISTSVFMKNYFNPRWIEDLGSRAINGGHELLNALKERATSSSQGGNFL